MRPTWKNILAITAIIVLFVPLVVFSPETVTKRLVAWFNLHPPEALPKRARSDQQALAEWVQAAISEADVRTHLTRLTSKGSRVVGYPGHEAAYHYIKDTFETIGLENVTTESYDVTSPIDKGGSLKIPGEDRTIPLYAVWPNLVRTSTLPRQGLRALLVDGGSGEFSDFNGKELEGSVVLMSFNSWNRWMNASMLGAKAVIFVAPDSTTTSEAEQKFFQVPLNVPRFWIGREEGEALRDRLSAGERIEVEVKGRMVWEKHQAHNVFGRITGRDPELKDEIVLFDAYYDAMSVVPALAPGAEQASGLVALLELAESLKAHPPARTVLFLASSAHHLGFRGVCDFLGRHARKEKHFAPLMTDPIDIRLWVSLDLSSHTNEIGVLGFPSFLAPLGSLVSQLGGELAPALGLDPDGSLVDGITPPTGMSWDMFIPGENIQTDAQVVRSAGIPALAFVTINDARFRVDTPLDTAEGVNVRNLTKQTQLLTGVFSSALDDPHLLLDHPTSLRDGMRALKGRILTFPRRSMVPDRPRPGAVAALRMTPEKTVKGVRAIFYDLADAQGEIYIPGVAVNNVALEAYYLDPETGAITYAPNRGPAASIYKSEFGMDNVITRATSILFPCIATDFYETIDPRHLSRLSQLSVYNSGNTPPQEYGYSLGYSPDEPAGVVFTRPGERVKLTMSAGPIGIRFMLLNSNDPGSEKAAQGEGFATPAHGAITHTAFQAAKDMWALDEARMRELEAYGVRNRRLNILHDQARHHLQRAKEARRNLRWDQYIKHARAALGVESRAYPDVKATQNDVVRGVVFFMALVIPCAFFAERLLITAADIRWQVTWLALIFGAIWIVLSAVHPAFNLSNPVVVLLAFVILSLALFVITLVFSRFNTHMRQIRTRGMGIHHVDVGRISASLAAFHLGIANMKRRKLRTVLTFTTLVLLTFTVLSFTSIKTSLRFHQTVGDHPAPYPGLLIRSKFWSPLEESALDYARADFADEAVIAPRSWYASKSKKAIRLKHGRQSANALGILGLAPSEARVTRVDTCLSAGRWFRDGERKVCVVPEPMAALLGLTEADIGQAHIRLFGEQFTVVGLADPGRLNALVDLDGEPLTPADYLFTEQSALEEITQQEEREKSGLDASSVEVMEFVHLDPDNVLIVPYQTLREVNSPLQAIGVRFHDPSIVKSRVEDFLSRLSVVLFAGIPRLADDGRIERIDVSIYSSLGQTSLQGIGDLGIPIAIAVLIVLNTMMGSVHERLREIGTYSSVGLAPVHIAFLFLAESCVYAVLGVVSGYLLGQGIAKLLLWQGHLAGLTLNYSSLSAVASSGLVMAVVILSTLYPAWRASRMAVPDITRRWHLPDPEGDRWHILFPFTVGQQEVLGLFAFLTGYFDYHTEESLGTFYTRGARLSTLATDRGQSHTIQTTLWLAPFDLGVSQTVRLKSTPTGDHGIHALDLTIDRLSGDAASWKRCNQRFMNLIRKQFLIWRTISPEAKARYREEGQRLIDTPAETIVTASI